MRTYRIAIILLIALCCGCGGNETPPDLARAARIIERFAAPLHLPNSMFSAAFPECKASQFVRYMDSDLAAAELPQGESGADEMERMQAEATGSALWPDGVGMAVGVPDTGMTRQIVLNHDDSRNLVIIEMYVDPAKGPVGRTEFTVPVVVPSEAARMFFESNAQLGARY